MSRHFILYSLDNFRFSQKTWNTFKIISFQKKQKKLIFLLLKRKDPLQRNLERETYNHFFPFFATLFLLYQQLAAFQLVLSTAC